MSASLRRPATRLGIAVTAAALLVLAAAPAAAENPVLDPEDDTEIAEALAEATAVHDVCYGYVLDVNDDDTGRFGGSFVVSSAGVGVPPTAAGCPRGTVLLYAALRYTSELSEAEDGASWRVVSELRGPTSADLEQQGLSAGDLTDDARAATTLRNAVLALPGLTAAQNGLPPVVAEPNTDPLPPDAAATGSPGSDWLREHTGLLVLCLLVVLAALAVFAASFRSVRATARAVGTAMSNAAE